MRNIEVNGGASFALPFDQGDLIATIAGFVPDVCSFRPRHFASSNHLFIERYEVKQDVGDYRDLPDVQKRTCQVEQN